MRRFGFLVLLALLPFGASAASRPTLIEGVPQVIDGDTVKIEGQRVRFFGIDAPESTQVCDVGQNAWRCGAAARDMLAREIGRGEIHCAVQDTDPYGRLVAICENDRGEDLNAFMVHEGLAVAYAQYSTRYVGLERQAQAQRYGIWAGPFTRPDAYRHGQTEADDSRSSGSLTDRLSRLMDRSPNTSTYDDARYASRSSEDGRVASAGIGGGFQAVEPSDDLQDPDFDAASGGELANPEARIPENTQRPTMKGMACVVLGKGCAKTASVP